MKHHAVIYLLAVSVFIMATSELVVAGILTMIADDLNVSIATAGQLVALYAVGIAVGSPVMISAAARMERRRLLLLSCLVFVACWRHGIRSRCGTRSRRNSGSLGGLRRHAAQS